MSKVCFAVSLAVAAASVSPSANAAEVVYAFSGTIFNQFQFSAPIPEWQFETGKSFSGTLKIDTSLISGIQNVVSSPSYNFTRYRGAITAFSYSIDTTTGVYAYAPPTQGSSYAVGAGTQAFSFNGVDLRWQNYPAAFGGTPQLPVPNAARIGAYTPHASFLTLGSDVRPGLLADTDPNVDLAALGGQLTRPIGFGDTRSLTVRFSNPALWPPGQERIDAIVMGDITKVWRVSSAVPEPASWAMMIAGFGLVGFAMRRKVKPVAALA